MSIWHCYNRVTTTTAKQTKELLAPTLTIIIASTLNFLPNLFFRQTIKNKKNLQQSENTKRALKQACQTCGPF